MVKYILTWTLGKTNSMSRVFFLLLSLIKLAFAQPKPPGADIYSFSNSTDVISALQQVSALAGFQHSSVSVFGSRRYLLPDLNSFSIGGALRTSSGNFGLAASYFGLAAYHEMLTAVAYGRRIGAVSVGARFNFFSASSAGYKKVHDINFEAGIRYSFPSGLRLGCQLSNPLHFTAQKEFPSVPFSITTGFGYEVSDNFFIGGIIIKKVDLTPEFQAGLQYIFANKLFARVAMLGAGREFYFGLGYLLGNLRLDLSTSLHTQLGPSPALMISYLPGGTK
jgi:hypothetical protein